MASSARIGNGIAHGTFAVRSVTPDGLTLVTWGGIHGITSSASSVMNDRVTMMPGRPCACRMKGDSNVKTPE